MLVAAIVVGLFFWQSYAGGSSDASTILTVHLPTVIAAGITGIIAIISWIVPPQNSSTLRSFLPYGGLVVTTALLVLDTGGIESPLLALWAGVALFSGVFGVYGLVPVFFAVNTYLFTHFISGMTQSDLVTALLVGELPVIASLLIWSRSGQPNDTERIGRDPTMYKRASNELSELADQSEVVINAIGDGVIAVDAQGIIRLINPAAQELLGWSRTDALTLDYKSVLALSDANGEPLQQHADPVLQVLNTNQEFRAKNVTLTTKNEKKLYIAIVASPVGQSGSGVIVVFRDITKDRQEEREQAEFISTASHEMRTPVASIEGYLGLALNPNTAQIDDKARDFITKAHESAEHLGRLFQDLLDVTKAEDGRISNNPQAIELIEYTDSIVEGLRAKAEAKGISLVFSPHAHEGKSNEKQLTPMYYVNLDKDHVREIIANLTENGIKYTPSGEVVVDITGDDKNVVVSVKDSGIGIPAEDVPHLFQKFYRVDNSETREIGGTGLGLYLCRRLSEAMGGRVWAESEYKKGSTFFLQLPRISMRTAQQLLEEAAASANSPVNAAQPVDPAPPETQAPAPAPIAPPAVATSPITNTMPPATQQSPAPTVPPPYPLSPQQPAQPLQPQPVTPIVSVQAPAEPNTQTTVNPPTNVPLSSIEQNPSAYIAERAARINIPERRPPTQ